MKAWFNSAWAAWLALGLVGLPLVATAGEKAVCIVCSVKEGTTEPEEQKATRTYEGKVYGFCTDACAAEFEADPLAFLPPSLPRPAPELSVKDLGGKSLTWESLQGKVVLVDFWATWCAPCRKSMPELQRLHDRYASKGFTVVGISTDEGRADAKVKKFVASKKIRYPIAIDAGKAPVWERYRVKAVPAAFLVDGRGQIVAQWTGAIDADAVEAKITEALAVSTQD